jgi:hypothetical protein
MRGIRFLLAAALLSSAAFGVCSSKQKADLNVDSTAACQRMRRALYVMQQFPDRIKEHFGTKGSNFPVYYKNPGFYKTRLKSRVAACTKGPISMKCVGHCTSANETVAYVLVTFGFVGSTIHFCDEYFTDAAQTRAETMAHEFGRLEDIGDSSNFDTDNIFVWDAIVRGLSDDTNYATLTRPR